MNSTLPRYWLRSIPSNLPSYDCPPWPWWNLQQTTEVVRKTLTTAKGVVMLALNILRHFFSVIALSFALGDWRPLVTDFYSFYFLFATSTLLSLFDTAAALEQLKPIREGLSWHASATSKATKTRHYHHHRWLPAKSGAKRAAKR